MTPRKTVLDGFAHPSELAAEPIPDYEGMPVVGLKAKITNTGDGLSESMDIAPMHIPSESQVVIVTYATVVRHAHDRRTTGRGEDRIVHDDFIETVTLRADGSFLIDPDLLGKPITEHQKRVAEHRAEVERKRQEEKGQFGLPFPQEDVDEADGAQADDNDDSD